MINSRAKGGRGEREVVNFWKAIFPKAKRHLEFQAVEAERGVDVDLDSIFVIQVKTGDNVPKTIYKYLEQMKLTENEVGFVQCKKDRKEWLVILKAEDFKKLLQCQKQK